nr:non-specific lipid-transfer protein 2-like [Ipomoea batatas]
MTVTTGAVAHHRCSSAASPRGESDRWKTVPTGAVAHHRRPSAASPRGESDRATSAAEPAATPPDPSRHRRREPSDVAGDPCSATAASLRRNASAVATRQHPHGRCNSMLRRWRRLREAVMVPPPVAQLRRRRSRDLIARTPFPIEGPAIAGVQRCSPIAGSRRYTRHLHRSKEYEVYCEKTIANEQLVLLLLLGKAQFSLATCDAKQLNPCLSALTFNLHPPPQCCERLNQQKPCFCQYVKNPNLKDYLVNSAAAKKVYELCKVTMPKC